MRKRILNLQLLAAPVISRFYVYRSDEDGNATDDGIRVTIIYEYSCDSSSATMEIKYKNVNDSDYENTIITGTGASGSGTITPSTTFSVNEGFDFRITITDDDANSARVVTVTTANIPFSIYKTGNGVAFGKSADTDRLMDVQYKAQFLNYVTVDNDLSESNNARVDIYNEGDSGNTGVYMRSYAGGRLFVGLGTVGINKGLYDYNLGKWFLFTDENGDTWVGYPDGFVKPYFSAGDSVSPAVYTAGFVSSGGSNVYFTLPLYRPVVGEPTIRVTCSNMIVRQDGNYCYGASADSGVSPSSITALASSCGLTCTAVMRNTTNAVNNAPCGIQGTFNITFS